MNSAPVAFIINPAAGSSANLDELTAAIRAAFPQAELAVAAEAGDSERLAAEAVDAGCGLVVAAGGDGTLHEVINGLHGRFARTRLGLLPLGTGNDFARSIGLPATLPEALAILQNGRSARLDVVRLSGAAERCMINVSGGGFSALVDEKMTDERKETWGPLSDARSFLEALPEREEFAATVALDGVPLDVRASAVFVANARYVARGIPIAPRARLDDGLLDVIILPVASLARIAVLAPVTLAGAHLDSEDVVFRRARTVRVESDPPMRFNADGELLPEGPLTFECLPGAVDFIVGELPADEPQL